MLLCIASLIFGNNDTFSMKLKNPLETVWQIQTLNLQALVTTRIIWKKNYQKKALLVSLRKKDPWRSRVKKKLADYTFRTYPCRGTGYQESFNIYKYPSMKTAGWQPFICTLSDLLFKIILAYLLEKALMKNQKWYRRIQYLNSKMEFCG